MMMIHKKNQMNQRLEIMQKKAKHIREATEKPSVARVFFLILDKIDYTKAIAEAYYCSGNNKKMKSLPNPKVIAIYLSTLKQARLIKKKEKEGKIQRYEIDWNGFFDLISLGNGEFSEAYWNAGYGNFNLKDFKKINKFFINNFVKPYFEKRKEELKLAYHRLEINGKTRKEDIHYYQLKEAHELNEKYGTEYCKIPKYFDNVDFNLDYEINTISSLIIAPYYFNNQLIVKFLKNKKNRNNPLFLIFDFIKKYNEMIQLGERMHFDASKKFLIDKVISIIEK